MIVVARVLLKIGVHALAVVRDSAVNAFDAVLKSVALTTLLCILGLIYLSIIYECDALTFAVKSAASGQKAIEFVENA